ncbi:MAG TPA: thioredoxin domain-containing protein [Anaerolineales bacterium]|nr:thioredoxin domain-containing protein [Anaerolineales bacterium]
MVEDQVPQEPASKPANRSWVRWVVGGGCLIAICAVVALGIVFFYFWLSDQGLRPPVQGNAPSSEQYPQASGNTIGDPNAPVKMTDFSDFQCPYCKRYWQSTEPMIIENYVKTGKVLYTYRSAGNWVSQNIGQGGTESQDAAAAAYCAGDQNKFWEYHDALFTNALGEDAGSFTGGRLKSIAEKTGLDTSQFDSCYDSQKYSDQVKQDLQDALAAGIQGTPFFVITYTVNGQTQTTTIEGAQPYDVFQQTLDSVLQGQ